MHCLVVYKEDYPWDVRVEKVAKSLAQAGHEVTILCSNLAQKETKEKTEDFSIQRLPRLHGWPSLMVKLANLPLWFNPIWLWAIFAYARKHRCIIIVRDLPLISAGIFVGRVCRSKVVLDMAECYPEMYASMAQFRKQPLSSRVLKNPRTAAKYERAALPHLDHTFVMIEESRDRLLKLGVSPDKVTIVSNTPAANKFGHRVAEHTTGDIRLVYVGFLTHIRGLDILVRAIRAFVDLNRSGSSIRFDIVGKGAAREILKELVSELQLEEQVKIHGWLDHNEVDALMEQANVGALTYRVCGHWNHTIPNKIFDYMLAGLPVLATEVVPIARIIRDHDCGVVCRDQDVQDVGEKLLALRDPALRNHYGQNGHRAVIEHYNWERDEEKLRGVIRKLGAA